MSFSFKSEPPSGKSDKQYIFLYTLFSEMIFLNEPANVFLGYLNKICFIHQILRYLNISITFQYLTYKLLNRTKINKNIFSSDFLLVLRLLFVICLCQLYSIFGSLRQHTFFKFAFPNTCITSTLLFKLHYT